MPGRVEREQLKSDLILPWVIVGMMLAMLAAYIIVCQTMDDQLQEHLPEDQRELIRSIFYAVAIATFPVTNLIRHIQLRLNQTMPCSHAAHGAVAEAKNRYLVTIIVSMSLIESVGILGFVMFIFGDDFNTLYIFTGLSALGLFLYRPKPDEYFEIIEALAAQKHE
jgi:hypothetical protein